MIYSQQVIKRVAEIGVLACELGRLDDAEVIFNGVSAIAESPAEKTAANLGLAATKIAAGDFETGIELLFEELSAVEYENMEALTLLVFALKQNGQHKEAEKLIPKLNKNPEFKGSLAEEAFQTMEG